jgi:hypothetical protein
MIAAGKPALLKYAGLPQSIIKGNLAFCLYCSGKPVSNNPFQDRFAMSI